MYIVLMECTCNLNPHKFTKMLFFFLTAYSLLLCLVSRSYANPTHSGSSLHPKQQTPDATIHYDVVIVGGGPAGLSALGGLARVRRTALLIDSGEYRNNKTLFNHDIIGFDGEPPAFLRAKAREQIVRYPTAYMMNETVTSISPGAQGKSFITTVSSGVKYTSRKIILATGVVDILPDTQGFRDAWARGMYWCPWCDSWEHRDQSLGVIGTLPSAIKNGLAILTLNKDVIVFVNGTNTPENRACVEAQIPGWQKKIEKAGITVENRTITGIVRLRNGTEIRNETTWEEYDLFQVNLEDGAKVLRQAFLASFPTEQRSYLGQKIGAKLYAERIDVDPQSMRAAPGVWAIGDANNDNTTNVPHALYTGKKAAVSAHFELAREDSALSITKRSESDLLPELGSDMEDIWHSLSVHRVDTKSYKN